MNILVIAEDFVKDEHVLQPIVKAMMQAVGRPRAKVKVCKDPRFHGTGEALRWELVQQVINRHKGMVDLFLLCVDRDGNEHRRKVLDGLELKAQAELGTGRAFLAENAWQEVEVWLLMGHDMLAGWQWKEVRAEPHPKELYYLPFAEHHRVLDLPGEGRGKLAREAAARYDRIRQRCREDVQNLEKRITNWLEQPS